MNKRNKLQTAVSDGNLGRAREILSGRVKSSPFSTQLYEQFGVVLLQIGDYAEAGKFLFLSGVPNTTQPSRCSSAAYSRAGWQSLVESFPRRVKRGTWRALPANVRAALEANGAPRQNDGQYIFKTLRAHPVGRISCWGLLLLSLAILLTGLLVSVVVAYLYVLAEVG